jgi:hypothetical protein
MPGAAPTEGGTITDVGRFRVLLTKGTDMAEKKGKGSDTAQKANAKAAKDGEANPRKSSAAQSELGKKGAKEKKG